MSSPAPLLIIAIVPLVVSPPIGLSILVIPATKRRLPLILAVLPMFSDKAARRRLPLTLPSILMVLPAAIMLPLTRPLTVTVSAIAHRLPLTVPSMVMILERAKRSPSTTSPLATLTFSPLRMSSAKTGTTANAINDMTTRMITNPLQIRFDILTSLAALYQVNRDSHVL